MSADSRVGGAVYGAKKRSKTDSCVFDCGCVVRECTRARSCVFDAGCVTEERIKSDGCVVAAGGETVERTVALSRVVVWIASIRSWGNRQSPMRGEADKSQQKKTGSQQASGWRRIEAEELQEHGIHRNLFLFSRQLFV